MKTTLLQPLWSSLRRASCVPMGAAAVAALLLAPTKLAALPSVQTISGGPGPGYLDGDTAATALFNTPVGMALDSSRNFLYVADRANNAIRELNLSGNLTFTFATYGVYQPVGVALDSDGNVYVLNHGNGSNGTVLKFDIFGDFLGTLASGLVDANGLVIDAINNLYVTCNANSVLQIAPDGATTTIATISAASIRLRGITIMNNGFLAVADSVGNGIWLIDPSTGNVSQLTGFNGAGDHFGTKAFAKFNQPVGVAATGGGMVVVTDFGNNRVKVVDSAGTVTNLYGVDSSFWVTGAGTYPGWADGTVCAGDLNYNSYGCVESRAPAGVLFASNGDVYTTEDYYHLIRKVTGTGLPQPPPPQPPVPDPAIGWVDFTVPPSIIVSILRTSQPFIFNNDVIIAIEGTPGTETHFTYGPTPIGVDTIPDPSATVGSTPPAYHDGMFPDQVPPSILPVITNDVTFKVIGTQPGRQSSAIVKARFQFKVANPLITGNNAALFTVTDQTTNAVMWYTVDGSDPIPAYPSIGPIVSGATVSLNASSNVLFKIRAFRQGYQDSDIVSATFSPDAFIPNSITFGFNAGEGSSDFVGAPGQFFYAPVTLNIVPGTKIYSMQFNLTVTNAGPNPGPAIVPGTFQFQSFLEKPIPGAPGLFERIPPLMFSGYQQDPPPTNQIVIYDGEPFVNLSFTNTSENLLGVGWLERATQTNLYDTTKQDLIKYSQAHDTLFDESGGKVLLGGYGIQIPANAQAGQTYQIQIGRPSATLDGIGMPGSDVVMVAPTNGSMSAGAVNAIKWVVAGQRKYIAGDSAPFRWFNAGDYGDTNLNNADVEQVFQSAIYGYNSPPPGSDFFDSMDSCGGLYTQSSQGYFIKSGTMTSAAENLLFNGNDQTINQIAFGDGILDVCDVYVTFRRSLDPSLTWVRRFWTNGVLGAEFAANQPPTPLLVGPGGSGGQNPQPALSADGAAVRFVSSDALAAAGQTVTIPITANVFGSFPLRVAMLNLSVVPLDGSPALTTPVQFTPNPALGQPSLTASTGNGNYAATWLNSTVAGLSGSAIVGTLTVQIPANATQWSAYAVHFDHASGSPNGIASFPKQTVTGLITLSDRSTSSFNDGIPDSWRLRYFGTVNNLLSQANADADGDGANNWQEYVAGTDPTDPKSCLRVSAVPSLTAPAADCGVHWPSVLGKQYIIERSTDLFAPNWIPISTNIGSGTDMEFHDIAGGTVRFYRVRVGP